MLKRADIAVDERIRGAGDLVHYGLQSPGAFRKRMDQLQAIHRWLSAYFEATAIMLQIPGASEYEYLEGEDPDNATEHIWNADRDMLFSILAEALERLEVSSLIEQVPGAENYRTRKLPVELRLILAERDRNGVMNIAAECLDWLMVIPEIEEDWNIFGEPPQTRRGLRRVWHSTFRYLRGWFRWRSRP